MKAFLPVKSMDEVFICGPETMIEATQKALVDAGVPAQRVYTERFASGVAPTAPKAPRSEHAKSLEGIALTVVFDGKSHEMRIQPDEHILDVALNAGLDLPYSCKGGVCVTCRCKVLEGEVTLELDGKTFTAGESDVVGVGCALDGAQSSSNTDGAVRIENVLALVDGTLCSVGTAVLANGCHAIT